MRPAQADYQRKRAAALVAWNRYRRVAGIESITQPNRLPGEPATVPIADVLALVRSLTEAFRLVASTRHPKLEDVDPWGAAGVALGMLSNALQRVRRLVND